MRIRLLTSLIALSATLHTLAAQSSAAGPDFNALRTPASPAFVLLGVAPTTVERPNTPADLALSVLNRGASLTNFPKDVALEVSPYWLVKHPMLRWQDDNTRSPGTSVARTMTISLATAEVGTTARPVTGLAIGVRAAPFSGRLPATTVARLQALGDRLGIESSVLAKLRAERLGVLEKTRTQELQAATTDSARREVLNRFNTARAELTASVLQSPEYKAAVDSTEQMFRDLAVIREGFVLEVAGGAAFQAAAGVADSAKLARWGAWLTAGYEGKSLSFVFVSRYLASSFDSIVNAFDMGTRVTFARGRSAFSAEGSLRSFTQRNAPSNQYHVAAVVDFELHEGLWVTGTFGRDYASGSPGSLIAHIGLSVNINGQRINVPVGGL